MIVLNVLQHMKYNEAHVISLASAGNRLTVGKSHIDLHSRRNNCGDKTRKSRRNPTMAVRTAAKPFLPKE